MEINTKEKTINNNKSPYEIRYELLDMAKNYLVAEFDATVNNLHAIEEMVKTEISKEHLLLDPKKFFGVITPKFPTADDIISLAKKYNEFITTK